MEVKNNPAGRLYDLLKAAKKQPPREKVRDVWAKVFDVDPADTALLLTMIADLIILVANTKASIERLENVDNTLYLKPFVKLENLFSQVNLNASWEPWHKQLDEPTLYGLQFAADQLSRNSGKTALSGKDIESLQSELEQLLDNVIGSDIPQGLKALFLRNLESIRHSVLVYRIQGIDGLEEELERAVGFLVLNRQDIPAEGDPSESRKYWEKFFSLVDRINQLVALGRGVKELSGPAMHAISHILGK